MSRMQTHFSHKKNIYLSFIVFLPQMEIFFVEIIVEGASRVHHSVSHSIHDLQVIFPPMNQPGNVNKSFADTL